jgi:hypothetical protein
MLMEPDFVKEHVASWKIMSSGITHEQTSVAGNRAIQWGQTSHGGGAMDIR